MTNGALIDMRTLNTVVEDGMRRYFAERRALVKPFVEANFGWRGAFDINRRALGADILKAPLNAALVAPALALKGAAFLAGRAGATRTADYLASRDLFLETDVGREIEWRVFTGLLELPYAQGSTGRRSERDALEATILSDPRLDALWAPALKNALSTAQDERLKGKLRDALSAYASTRAATGEVAGLGLSLAAGALLAQKVTPGILSLGPMAAQLAAEQIALTQFPLGAGAAKVWYALVPVPPSIAASFSAAVALLGLIAAASAFAGFVLDPIQKEIGLHERRLTRMISSLERSFLGDDDARYVVRDHYAARLFDLFDAVAAVWAVAR